jgi:hypothetical protein
MTEFGRTPMMTAGQFQSLGYYIVMDPVSLFRFAAGRTPSALEGLRKYGNQKKMIAAMMRRERINRLLDYKPGQEGLMMSDNPIDTLDTGLANVAVCNSDISFTTADKDGNPILLYRGYSIDDLVRN